MGGLVVLAQLEHARMKRISAKFARAHGNMYSTDSREYQRAKKHAAYQLQEAEKHEAIARYLTRRHRPY